MEYKAISQASYKFTSTRETTIQGADVLNSGFRFGTIKTTDNMVLQIAPSNYNTQFTDKKIELYTYSVSSYPSEGGYSCCKLYPCTIDGNTYYGTKRSSFSLGSFSSLGIIYSNKITLKNGTLKVLRYDSSIENIVLDEYSTNGISSTTMSASNSSSSSYIQLNIYKQTNDIILAVWWEEETTTTTSK